MGLEEKRKIKEIQDLQPQFEAELKEKCGMTASVDVDAESLSTDALAFQQFKNNFFTDDVTKALLIIGKDSLGKEALQEIKKIVIKNVAEASQKKLTLDKGVLEIHVALSKGNAGRYFSDATADQLKKLL